MKCPICGKRLKADYPEGWYNCNSCGDRFYNDGGNLLTVRQMRAKRNHRTCVVCQQSLEGGEYTAPWENGNNPDGYTKCHHCGSINYD